MGAGGSLFEVMAAINAELALFAATGFLVGGVDDLLVDLLWFGSRLRRSPSHLDQLLEEAGPPDGCPLAIFVPAWDEAAVIGAMLAETLRRFGDQDYRLYVGCYPNDPATLAVIEPIAASDPRLRIAMCESGIM